MSIIDCISGETEFLRSMKLNERIWGAFGDKILVYQYIDDNTIGLVSWDLNDTSNDEVLFTWKMNDTYPILGDGVLSYVGDDGYFHLMDLQSKEDSRMTLTPMAIPMGTIPSPGSAAIICSMVLLGTMQTVSTMTRRRLFPWRQYITSRIGRVRSLCLLSATMCLLLNSAEHWLRMVWM